MNTYLTLRISEFKHKTHRNILYYPHAPGSMPLFTSLEKANKCHELVFGSALFFFKKKKRLPWAKSLSNSLQDLMKLCLIKDCKTMLFLRISATCQVLFCHSESHANRSTSNIVNSLSRNLMYMENIHSPDNTE